MSQPSGSDSGGAGGTGVAAVATCGVTAGAVAGDAAAGAVASNEVARAVGVTPGFSIRSKLITKSVVPKAATRIRTKAAKRHTLLRRAGMGAAADAWISSAKR